MMVVIGGGEDKQIIKEGSKKKLYETLLLHQSRAFWNFLREINYH